MPAVCQTPWPGDGGTAEATRLPGSYSLDDLANAVLDDDLMLRDGEGLDADGVVPEGLHEDRRNYDIR